MSEPLIVIIEKKTNLVVELPPKDILTVEIPPKNPLVVELLNRVTINRYETEGDVDAFVEVYEAGEFVNVNRAVVLRPDGRIQHADKDDDDFFGDVVGITRQSGAIGAEVEVVTFGKLNGAVFAGVAENLFLGNNGLLTSTAPASGIWQSMGFQSGPSEFFVTVGEPIQQ